MKLYRRVAKLHAYLSDAASYAEALRVAGRLVRLYHLGRDLAAHDLVATVYVALAVGPKKLTGCGIPGAGTRGRSFPARVSTRRVFLRALDSVADNIAKWRRRHPHVAFVDSVEDMDFTDGRKRGTGDEYWQRGFHRETGEDGEIAWNPRRSSPTPSAFYDGASLGQ